MVKAKMRALGITLTFCLVTVILCFFGWSRLPDMLGNSLSKKLGVRVSIDALKIAPSEINVKKLEIASPKGYTLAKAFSAETSSILAPLFSYFGSPVLIDTAQIDNIYLGLEFDSPKGTSGNWTKILKNYQKSARLQENKKNPRRVLIKNLIFTNITTDLVFLMGGSKTKRLPKIDRIELHNIDSGGGLPRDQLINSILGQMLKQVFIEYHLNNMLEGILPSPNEAIDSLVKPFKGMFNAVFEVDADKKCSA